MSVQLQQTAPTLSSNWYFVPGTANAPSPTNSEHSSQNTSQNSSPAHTHINVKQTPLLNTATPPATPLAHGAPVATTQPPAGSPLMMLAAMQPQQGATAQLATTPTMDSTWVPLHMNQVQQQMQQQQQQQQPQGPQAQQQQQQPVYVFVLPQNSDNQQHAMHPAAHQAPVHEKKVIRCYYCGGVGHKATHCAANPNASTVSTGVCAIHGKLRSISYLCRQNGEGSPLVCVPGNPCLMH